MTRERTFRKEEIALDVVTRTPPPCPYCGDRTKSYGTATAHVLLCTFGPGFDLKFSPLPRELSEAAWQRIVEDLAKGLGWERACHVRPARVKNRVLTPTSDPGFPDLWIIRPGRLVVLELKSHTGQATPDQIVWVNLLQSLGENVEAFVVRPYDWPEVVELLLPRDPDAP